MEKDLDYSHVPYTFMHCIHASCVRANDCVRHLIMQHVPSSLESLLMLNPTHIPGDGKDCSYFFADKKVRFALGTRHLLDNIPYKKAMEIRQALRSYFGKSTYYRIRNQERPITPDEQSYVRQIFLRKGVGEEPVFDEYFEQYDW